MGRTEQHLGGLVVHVDARGNVTLSDPHDPGLRILVEAADVPEVMAALEAAEARRVKRPR